MKGIKGINNMGYFSDLNLEVREGSKMDTRSSFEDQMLYRYEDLKDRYLDMQSGAYSYAGDNLYCREDYLYSPIECFDTLYDVARAMEIVREELEKRGCAVSLDDKFEDERVNCERDPDQLTIFEMIFIPTEVYAAAVA